MRNLIFSLTTLILAGCGSVMLSDSFESLVKDDRAPRGIHYFLPKATIAFHLTVVPNTAVVSLTIESPTIIQDPDHQYFLRHRPLPNYKDRISIILGPKQFLKRLEVVSEDRTKQVITNVAKTFKAAQSLESAVRTGTEIITLAKVVVDPADEEDLEEALKILNEALRNFARGRVALCPNEKEISNYEAAVCDEYSRLSYGRPVKFGLNRPKFFSQRPNPKPADCNVGICYRPTLPYRMAYSVGNGVKIVHNIDLPNKAPPIELDLERAMLVLKTWAIDFDDNGRLLSVAVVKPSELEALSEIPLEVVQILLATPAQATQWKSSRLKDEATTEEARQKTIIAWVQAVEKYRADRAAAGTNAGQRPTIPVASNLVFLPPEEEEEKETENPNDKDTNDDKSTGEGKKTGEGKTHGKYTPTVKKKIDLSHPASDDF